MKTADELVQDGDYHKRVTGDDFFGEWLLENWDAIRAHLCTLSAESARRYGPRVCKADATPILRLLKRG